MTTGRSTVHPPMRRALELAWESTCAVGGALVIAVVVGFLARTVAHG